MPLSSFELDAFDDELAALDDLDPPRATGGAREIRVLADRLAAAVGTAELRRDENDREPGAFGKRSLLVGLEGRFEEVGRPRT